MRNVHSSVVGADARRAHAIFVLVHTGVGIALATLAVASLVFSQSMLPAVGQLLAASCAALALGVFLIHTGALHVVRSVSLGAFSALVCYFCIIGGGLNSPALVLLALGPLEAARLANPNLAKQSLLWAALAILSLVALTGAPSASISFAITIGIVLYACTLAYGSAFASSGVDPSTTRAKRALALGSFSKPNLDIPASGENQPLTRVTLKRRRAALGQRSEPRPASPSEQLVRPTWRAAISSPSTKFCVQEGDRHVR